MACVPIIGFKQHQSQKGPAKVVVSDQWMCRTTDHVTPGVSDCTTLMQRGLPHLFKCHIPYPIRDLLQLRINKHQWSGVETGVETGWN